MAAHSEHTFSARLDCHYLLRTPETVHAHTPLVVTLHGFGMNAEIMFQLTARLFDVEPVLVALQGPYPFFLSTANQEVGYGWITNRHPGDSIRLHHDMLSHVLDEAGGKTGIPASRHVLVGFSQSVGLNYRYAATYPDRFRGVIGICGGLPGDWETGAYQSVRAALLHIARGQDEIYPPQITGRYAERLRRRASDVEFHLLEGGHQMPSAGKSVVSPWLRRILAS